MKKILFAILIVLFFAQMILGIINIQCQGELKKNFTEGKYLVLKVDGIPTMLQKVPGNLGTKTRCEIVIGTDGKWKVRGALGGASNSSNVLSKGELLLLTSIDFNKESFEIRTKTDKALTYDIRGRATLIGSDHKTGAGIHANTFFFKVDPGWDCTSIQAAVKNFFDIYETREEITQAKEIKVGMTIEEVALALGEPLKKADMGDGKLIYKYEDTVVTFYEEKVVNIEFK